jgi:thioredoxin reductase
MVIVGGGPAGMSAAIEARRHGVEVVLIEERATLGGQIYKRLPEGAVADESELGRDYEAGSALIARYRAAGAETLLGATVWGVWGNEVAVETADGTSLVLTAARILIATGAYDRPVAFPGWTLPGVITAGGAQSLAKVQRVAPGRRVVMAGCGALPMAFAAQLHKLGVNVVAVYEASPFPSLAKAASLALAAPGNLDLLKDAAAYLSRLTRHGIAPRYGRIVVRAEGDGRVERVVTAAVDADWRPIPGTEETIAADALCVGYGLFPSSELAQQTGCKMIYDEALGGWIPERDADMRTSLTHVYSAGDGAGVRGVYVAREQGSIAGLAIARDLGIIGSEQFNAEARPFRARSRRREKFQSALRTVYPVRPGVYELANDETTICRCEEVTLGQLKGCGLETGASAHALKTETRAGMGLCQGRNCNRQLAALVAQQARTAISDVPRFAPRAPVKLVSLGVIADEMPEKDHVDLVF